MDVGAPEVGLIATNITRRRGLVRRKAIVAAIIRRIPRAASSAAGSPYPAVLRPSEGSDTFCVVDNVLELAAARTRSTSRASTTATPARSSPRAARTFFQHARSRAPFMKPLATRSARSQRPRPTPSPCRERKKVEMLFAHLKRILRLGRLRLRGPSGAKDEFLLAATAQNLRKLAKLIPLPAPIFAT